MKMPIKSVTVFCGSRFGNKPEFRDTAYRLGCELSKHSVSLRFGGGRFGMMGAVAKGVIENGGSIIPVPTDKSWAIEANSNFVDERTGEIFDYTGKANPIFASNFMERKKLLRTDTDGFCVLPGSIGTYDEMFEVMVLNYAGEIKKPIVLLDVLDYWQKFKDILTLAVDNGFGNPSIFNLVSIVNKPEDVIPTMEKIISSY